MSKTQQTRGLGTMGGADGGVLASPTDLGATATRDISGAMNAILADVFALYVKTKNFHWHLSGPHFRDYHLLFDEQGDRALAPARDDPGVRARETRGSR